MDFDNNKNKNNNIIVESLTREQKEIEENIRYLNDEDALIFFNEHKDDISYNKTINIKLYWIDIKYRLSKSDKYVLLELLDKTKVLIKKCIPNREDLFTDIDNNIDLEFIKHYIDNNINDSNFFYKIVIFIFSYVEKLQAKNKDKCLELFKQKCMEDLSNNVFYRDFIPKFFMEILDRLTMIYEEKKSFMKFVKTI